MLIAMLVALFLYSSHHVLLQSGDVVVDVSDCDVHFPSRCVSTWSSKPINSLYNDCVRIKHLKKCICIHIIRCWFDKWSLCGERGFSHCSKPICECRYRFWFADFDFHPPSVSYLPHSCRNHVMLWNHLGETWTWNLHPNIPWWLQTHSVVSVFSRFSPLGPGLVSSQWFLLWFHQWRKHAPTLQVLGSRCCRQSLSLYFPPHQRRRQSSLQQRYLVRTVMWWVHHEGTPW